MADCPDDKPRRRAHYTPNELIDPQAPPLGTPYNLILESAVPIAVQFRRMDSGQDAKAIMSTMACAERNEG